MVAVILAIGVLRYILPFYDLFCRYLNKLLFMLPVLHGEFRTQCLEVILGHIDKLDNAFVELNSKGLPQFLTHRFVRVSSDLSCQVYASL